MKEKKIYCADEKCSSRDRHESINIDGMLLLIGSSYKCPYCRGSRFLRVVGRKDQQVDLEKKKKTNRKV